MTTYKKGYTKRNITFLNTPKSGCMAAVSWSVQFYPREPYKRGPLKGTYHKSEVEASITLNDEAQHHYISNRGDLKALHVMRRELDAFEDATLTALQDKETEDAKS